MDKKILETSIWASDKPNKSRGTTGVTFSANAAKPSKATARPLFTIGGGLKPANTPANGRLIPCRDCRFAKVDPNACEYTPKRCKTCDVCNNPAECAFRLKDEICPEQELIWTAYECGNPDSEYSRALLNVTPHGDMQTAITWCGCEKGERAAVV